jgi:ubiquinone biosynthesis protein
MLRPIRTLFRLLAIARTLARHDALAALEVLKVAPGLVWLARLGSGRDVAGRPGQKLARALTELGPTFIKLGQFLSTRADLLGEELAADLSELQDRLPPFDSAAARATIEHELGQPIGALFDRFEDRPVSAASIAQVHLAVAKTAEPVPENAGAAATEAITVVLPSMTGAAGLSPSRCCGRASSRPSPVTSTCSTRWRTWSSAPSPNCAA